MFIKTTQISHGPFTAKQARKDISFLMKRRKRPSVVWSGCERENSKKSRIVACVRIIIKDLGILFSEWSEIKEGYQENCDDFLSKPFDLDVVFKEHPINGRS